MHLHTGVAQLCLQAHAYDASLKVTDQQGDDLPVTPTTSHFCGRGVEGRGHLGMNVLLDLQQQMHAV